MTRKTIDTIAFAALSVACLALAAGAGLLTDNAAHAWLIQAGAVVVALVTAAAALETVLSR